MRKLILIHCFFILISVAFFYVRPYGPNLVWNMFLALLAVDFAYFSYVFRKKSGHSLVLALAWFIFYPNTFYMLTDIVYLTWAPDVLNQQSALIFYGIFMSSMILAMSAGVISVQLMLERFGIRKVYLRSIFMVVLSILSSLAIHLGRFARLNSWDVLIRPMTVVRELRTVFTMANIWFLAVFAFFQIMTLLLLDRDHFY